MDDATTRFLIRTAHEIDLPAVPEGVYVCARCGGVRVTRSRARDWATGLIVAQDGVRRFLAAGPAGQWPERREMQRSEMFACDRTGCASFNVDEPLTAFVPGAGVWKVADRILIDGRIVAISGFVDRADELFAALAGGQELRLHTLAAAPATPEAQLTFPGKELS